MATKYTLLADYEESNLSEKELQLLSLMVLYPNLNNKELAKIMKISYNGLTKIINRPNFKKELELRSSLPIKILEAGKREAALTLIGLSKSAASENVKLKASALILNQELNNSTNDIEDTAIDFGSWNDN